MDPNLRYFLYFLAHDPAFVQEVTLCFVSVITILLGALFYRRMMRTPGSSPWTGVGIIAITFAVATSYRALVTPVSVANTMLRPFLTSTVVFALLVLVKMMVASWGGIICIGLLKPERVTKIGAKFLGFEFNQEIGPEVIRTAGYGVEEIGKQLKFLAGFNEEIAELMSWESEEKIQSCRDNPDVMRRFINDRLNAVYRDYPGTHVYVLADSLESFDELNVEIRFKARSVWNEERHIIKLITDRLGIALYHAEADWGAIIIIDSPERDLTQAEMAAAGILYTTVASQVETLLPPEKGGISDGTVLQDQKAEAGN